MGKGGGRLPGERKMEPPLQVAWSKIKIRERKLQYLRRILRGQRSRAAWPERGGRQLTGSS